MADSKVSELTAATSIGGSDLLYLVQSNSSKKIAFSTIAQNLGNVRLQGNIQLDTNIQSLSTPGLIDPSKQITHLSVDASQGILNIPQGTPNQVKIVVMTSASGGSYTLLKSNIGGNANVIFDTAGDTATLLFTNSKWYVIGGTATLVY